MFLKISEDWNVAHIYSYLKTIMDISAASFNVFFVFFHVSCQNLFVSYFMQCLLVCQIHNV